MTNHNVAYLAKKNAKSKNSRVVPNQGKHMYHMDS